MRKFAKALGSPGLGVALMLLSAAAVMAGIFFPRGPKPGMPGTGGAASGGLDLYRSPAFAALLAAMALNLLAHVLLRTRGLVLEMLSRNAPGTPEGSFREELGLRDDPTAVSACVALLTRFGFKVRSDAKDGMRSLFAEKGALWAWGSQVAHAGVLVILLAGAVSLKTRSIETILLKEGEAKPVRAGEFMVEADAAEPQFWRRSGEAKTYGPRLRILAEGRELASKRISFNDPLDCGGVRILQSGHRFAGALQFVRLRITGEGVKGAALVSVHPGVRLRMGDTGWQLAVERFEPDFVIDSGGKAGSRSDEFRNPAALVAFYKGEKRIGEAWAFLPGLAMRRAKGLLGVELDDFDPVMETGLTIIKDEGEPFFRVGAVLLVAGLIASLGFSRKRVWVHFPRRAGEKGTVFGDPGGKVYHFEREFKEMAAVLRSVT